MSTYNGLDRFDRTTETFTHYRFAEEQINNSNDNRILTIHLDRSGMGWIGTLNNGLAQFDPATEKFIRHDRHDARDPHSLSHNSVPIIHEDAEGTLWIATVEGLNKLEVSFHVSEKSDLSNPSSIRFEITDTDAGIPPEHLETIFEPFRQSGNAAQQAKGTGLGLAISRNLVELMGGVIQVRSQPGSGSAFWFELSLARRFKVNEIERILQGDVERCP